MINLENRKLSSHKVDFDKKLLTVLPKLDKEELSQVFFDALEKLLVFFRMRENKLDTALKASPIRSIKLKVQKPSNHLNGFWEPDRGRLVVFINLNLFQINGKRRESSVKDLERVILHELGHAFQDLLSTILEKKVNYEQVYASEAFAEMIYMFLNNGCDSEKIKVAFKAIITQSSLPFSECLNYPYPPDNNVKMIDAALLYFVYSKFGLKKLLETIEKSPANSTNIVERLSLFLYGTKAAFNPELKLPKTQKNKIKIRVQQFYDYLGGLLHIKPSEVASAMYDFYQS